VFLLGNGLFGVLLRLFFLLGLGCGVLVTFLGLQSRNYLFMAVGGLIIWGVAVLWISRMERDNEARMTHPLHLE
jgi:hypothetical protein